MADAKMTWALEDHVCRGCGGRILRCVTGNGMTPGGNPVYKCADCGKSTAAMGPEVLCWCGFTHRGQGLTGYRCLPFTVLKDRPGLIHAFRACGCEPGRTEVGIVLERDLQDEMAKPEGMCTACGKALAEGKAVDGIVVTIRDNRGFFHRDCWGGYRALPT